MAVVASIKKQEVREVYETIAGEYDERIPGVGPMDRRFTETENAFLLGKVGPENRVLDMGCGTGRFTVPLAERCASVVGLDISPSMLVVARANAEDRGVDAEFTEGDMCDLPFENAAFDVVTSMLALMHLPLESRQQAFSEAARVLRPGGRMLIGVKNSFIERLFRGDRFAAVDVTDVEHKKLVFTRTRNGRDLTAPWYSFGPDDLARLFATAGLSLVHLKGNSPLSAWLSDTVLADRRLYAVMRAIEDAISDTAPFNHFGYHLLAEAVKPAA